MPKTKIRITYTEACLIRFGDELGYTIAGEFVPRWKVVLTDVVCRKCGKALGEVDADMPRADLCMTCFEAFARHACDVTPAELLNERMTGQENYTVEEG